MKINIIALFCLVICQYISGVEMDSPLVLCLKFDEGTGLKVMDHSKSRNDGLAQGEHHWHSQQGLEFDGDSGGVILTRPLELKDSWTAEITFAANTTAKAEMMIMGNLVAGGKFNTSGWSIGLCRSELCLTWAKKSGDYSKISIDRISSGKIYHVAIVYDKEADKIIVYLNGVMISRKAADGHEPNSAKESIGFNAISNCWHFAGIVYEVNIYNKVLSSKDISRKYKDLKMPEVLKIE